MTKGTDQLASLIERLEQATTEAKDVVRELHAATKDGRTFLKEARQILDHEADHLVSTAVNDRIKEAGEHITNSMTKAIEMVNRRCTKEFDSFMQYARAPGLPTIAELSQVMAVLKRIENQHNVFDKEK